MHARALSHVVIVAALAVVVVNGLAGAGVINDTSPGAISDRYATVITPAGYAFSIWSLIYLGVGAFAIYQWLPGQQGDALLSRVRPWFVASCAANIGWIFAWHHAQIPLSLLVILTLLGTLVGINRLVAHEDAGTRFWVLKAPFNVYLGWIVVASTLNGLITTVYLELGLGDSVGVGVALILAATAIGIGLGRALRATALLLAMAWGTAAIAAGHAASTVILLVASAAALTLVGAAALLRRRTRA